jgi:hypothetical protein
MEARYSPSRTRTCDNSINSRVLYRLSYQGIFIETFGAPRKVFGIRFVSFSSLCGAKYCALKTGCETRSPKPLCSCFWVPAKVLGIRFVSLFFTLVGMWLSPRPISIRQLHVLPRFHPEPIYLVVFKGSYILGNLILRGASRLDAFSAYPVRT